MRELDLQQIVGDLVVVGGGLAGACCAITAARQGLHVTLVQDRPVLGGNSSSEVRLWVLGATSHMGNNNRWAREGGVINEILVENMWRNPEGNPVIFDSIVLEMVIAEAKITLLLNTAAHSLTMCDADTIAQVQAFNSQNQISYALEAPLFVDASGDGILGFLAGAEFRMGAEAASEFDERMASSEPEHKLLGHSLYFYSRDTGQPVRYIPPAFALKDITKIPRYRELRVSDSGCRLWWLEYGGDLDTVGQTEEIKWELWKVAYGVWDYIKNSGNFPDAECLTLEWMGMIPGKRESRRFVGDMMLTQNHIVEQTIFEDAVSFGGWAIDLHPSDGVFSPQAGCTQWHSKGVYQIPYRTLYSQSVRNLFLSGRLISATHIAFGSTRVMGTCAHNGQAVGMAAALCTARSLTPRDLLEPSRMQSLQQMLLRSGQHIPGVRLKDNDNLAHEAAITASSTFKLAAFRSSGELATSERSHALLLPVAQGVMPTVTLEARVRKKTIVHAQLWSSSRAGNTTPDILLASIDVPVVPGESVPIPLDFHISMQETSHVFVIVPPFSDGALYLSCANAPGVMTLSQKMNAAVAKSPVQTPPEDSGIDTFAFWLPERRPAARNLAVRIEPPIDLFGPEMVVNGFARPWCGVNGWAPDPTDMTPKLQLAWDTPQRVNEIAITFDTDFDHPMESVLLTHPEYVMPGCITAFRVRTSEGQTLAEVNENHQTRWHLTLKEPLLTRGITIDVLAYGPAVPAIFEVSCR
ncbi:MULTISPECIES: FAD-dependent oxidoreductase [Acidobacteriaceae]|uniref:FAD-dependent oxidoreductase n=1 Tax=Acidobacteriaceae TaxID=204434 RepID=UPI001C201A44|nr:MULTISPECIES: FAD-dependent oxidoreductase [Acidobacteriaceae]MDW5266243.1 FAD-dependent oxidoreductase [Edaphobacter sp.]